MFVYQGSVMYLLSGLLVLELDLLIKLCDAVNDTLLTWEHVGSLPTIDFLMCPAVIIGKQSTARTITAVAEGVSAILTLRRRNIL
jgi:hypothetical protein